MPVIECGGCRSCGCRKGRLIASAGPAHRRRRPHPLPFLKPGELLDGLGVEHFPHKVYEIWWPRARAESFQAG